MTWDQWQVKLRDYRESKAQTAMQWGASGAVGRNFWDYLEITRIVCVLRRH